MKIVAGGVASICFLAVCASAPMATAQAPTIRVQSSLVLVDVITQDRKSGLPVRDFKKGDFRLFDNRHEVRVATFDAGARYDTRSITLWLVVICNESGLPKFGASAEFLGQEALFRPALNHLETSRQCGSCSLVRQGRQPARFAAYRRPRQSYPRTVRSSQAHSFRRRYVRQ